MSLRKLVIGMKINHHKQNEMEINVHTIHSPNLMEEMKDKDPDHPDHQERIKKIGYV